MSHSKPRIFISGFGLVSPLGNSAWETFRALVDGRTIASRTRTLPEDVDAVDLIRGTGGVGIARHGAIDPSITLAEKAAREAMAMAGLSAGVDAGGVGNDSLPCVIGTSKGAVHALTQAANACTSNYQSATRATLGIALLPTKTQSDQISAGAIGPHEVMTHQLRQLLGLAETTHVVAACASSLVALHRGRQKLLRDDSLKRVLVVTADAALLPMFIHAYRRLGVLPKLMPSDYKGLPLDHRRDGFMLAEAGAAVVLERINEGATPAGKPIELLDTAEACDACDMIRPNAEMTALRHIAGKLLHNHDVDLIHPHAPGTREQDEAEVQVYRDLADNNTTNFYACKGAIGHSLGAAGLSSLVIACLCARTKRRPPMPWLEQPLDGVTGEASATNGGAQAVFAAGFGGHVAGAVIR